mgnify:CR=1 FL=1
MASALEAGVSLSEFWRATPRETMAAVKAYHRRRGWLAWHVAMLGRIDARSFPTLEQISGLPRRDRPRQSPEEMLAVIDQLKKRIQLRGAA